MRLCSAIEVAILKSEYLIFIEYLGVRHRQDHHQQLFVRFSCHSHVRTLKRKILTLGLGKNNNGKKLILFGHGRADVLMLTA